MYNQTDFLLIGNERVEFPYIEIGYSFGRFDDTDDSDYSMPTLKGPSVIVAKKKFEKFRFTISGAFIYYRTGTHKISTGGYDIIFSVVPKNKNIKKSNKKKITKITVNGVLVPGTIYDEISLINVIKELNMETRGNFIKDEYPLLDYMIFFVSLLYFNANLSKKSLTHHANLDRLKLTEIIVESEEYVHTNATRLIETIKNLNLNESFNRSNKRIRYTVEDLEIYADSLEYDSVYDVRYENIEKQYKKMVEKYKNNTNRLKIVNMAYNFLIEIFSK